VLSCNKGWDTSSWVTGTSAGSRCSSSRYSSSYDCPAACSWSDVRLSGSPQCRGLSPPALPPDAPANATCLLHPPCSSASGGGEPAAPDGPCYCCDLQLDTSGAAVGAGSGSFTVPTGQLWVLFLGQVAFLVWVLFLTRSQVGQVGGRGGNPRHMPPGLYICLPWRAPHTAAACARACLLERLLHC
jgi:hypothetical protein